MDTTVTVFPAKQPTERKSFTLGNIQTTLLIPLYARAIETQKEDGILEDDKAIEIVKSMDFNFSIWDKSPSLFGACLRTLIFDEMVSDFLVQHPTGTIIELGCGLNTRFERIDNGRAQWIELDLPDVIALRKQYFDAHERRSLVAASITTPNWFRYCCDVDTPVMFVSEAVLVYLTPSQVRDAILQLVNNFTHAYFAFDTTSLKMVQSQIGEDAFQNVSQDSWHCWPCDDPREIQSWHPKLKVIDSKTLIDVSTQLRARLPFPLKLLYRLFPQLMRYLLKDYRLSLAQW